jgi:excisionase family DNA binding protein
MQKEPFACERMLTPAEVAAAFSVDPRTVIRWAKSGRLHPVRTPGGHRRYREVQVRDLLENGPPSCHAQLGAMSCELFAGHRGKHHAQPAGVSVTWAQS